MIERSLPFSGKERVIKKLANKNKKRIRYASFILSLLAAKGLFFVLKTFLSISLSQISLAIQPKPLTNNPPNKIFI